MSWWAQAGIAALDFLSGTSAAEEEMDFNAEQAKINREWQEKMSNTAIQRRTEDLKKAGFNPIMAVQSAGGGASTPSGSSASGTSSPNSAFGAAKMQAAQIDLLEAQADKARSEAQMARDAVPTNAEKVRLDLEKLDAETSRVANEVRLQLQDLKLRDLDIERGNLTNEQLRQLQPLLLEAQRLSVQMQRLGIPQAEAEASFYRTVGSAEQWIKLVKSALPDWATARDIGGLIRRGASGPWRGGYNSGPTVPRSSSPPRSSGGAGPYRLKKGRTYDGSEKPDWRDWE